MGEAIIHRFGFIPDHSGSGTVQLIAKKEFKQHDTYTIPNAEMYSAIFCVTSNTSNNNFYPCIWSAQIKKNEILEIGYYTESISGSYASGPGTLVSDGDWTVRSTTYTPYVLVISIFFGIK